MFLHNRSAKLVETEELKDPLTVEVEHSQVIGLLQIVSTA